MVRVHDKIVTLKTPGGVNKLNKIEFSTRKVRSDKLDKEMRWLREELEHFNHDSPM